MGGAIFMRAHRAYLLGSGLAVAVLAFAAGLQVPSVSASTQAATQVATHDATTQVNRSLKGDRLGVSVSPEMSASPAAPQGTEAPRATPKLPDGCEASVSAMTRSSLAQTPGRCVS
jgi:glucose/arabinose dehydrogenase